MYSTQFFKLYLSKNYVVISSPHLTFQEANEIVGAFFLEDLNRTNIFKFKIEEKFERIHYVYTPLFSKIYSRTNNFWIQKKKNFDFHFQTWKNRKTTAAVGIKTLKQLPQSTAHQRTTKVIPNAKNPSNYQDRTVHKNEQKSIGFKIDDDKRSTMVKPHNAAQKNICWEKKNIRKTIRLKYYKNAKLKSNKL